MDHHPNFNCVDIAIAEFLVATHLRAIWLQAYCHKTSCDSYIASYLLYEIHALYGVRCDVTGLIQVVTHQTKISNLVGTLPNRSSSTLIITGVSDY